MIKLKVTASVVNRWGKKYIAKNGVIEVMEEDICHFEGFKRVAPTKTNTKTTNKVKNEDTNEGS